MKSSKLTLYIYIYELFIQIIAEIISRVEVTLLLLLSHFSSCLTPCDQIDGSPPGSSVPGFLKARTLEWVAVSFSSAWK